MGERKLYIFFEKVWIGSAYDTSSITKLLMGKVSWESLVEFLDFLQKRVDLNAFGLDPENPFKVVDTIPKPEDLRGFYIELDWVGSGLEWIVGKSIEEILTLSRAIKPLKIKLNWAKGPKRMPQQLLFVATIEPE